jgi:hemolysin III
MEAIEAAVPAKRVKPRYRGVSHAVGAGLTPPVAIVLASLANSPRALTVALVYSVSLAALFGVSAVYHCFHWQPRMYLLFRRLDHANIFLFIAATATPLAESLPPHPRALLLTAVWGGAVVGAMRAVFWPRAPRLIQVGLYLVVGWAVVPFLFPLYHALGGYLVGLVVAGGLLYSVGAVIYARRRPDPIPHVFGFHEIFHLFTLAAAAVHLVVVAQIVARLA